jgi:hypothetical protein
MKRNIIVAVLSLVVSMSVSAQTPTPPTPPPDAPIQHLVINASAVGFNGPSGTQAASVMGAGLQLTKRVSLGYLHVTIPAVSARFELGVANYTAPLSAVLGKKLSSKFIFDTSLINVTFQGGMGKLLQPTANRIAETAGVYITYPIASHVSFQVIGGQFVHGGVQSGLITRNYNAAVSTGLNFYF